MKRPDMALQSNNAGTDVWFRSMDLTRLVDKCAHLFPGHYAEVVGVDSLCIQWDLLRPLDEAGMFQSFVAIAEGGCVGYCAFVLQPDIFRANGKHANVIAIYVQPEHRRLGIYQSLLRMVRGFCEAVEAHSIRMHAKPGSVLDAILSTHRNGWKSFENIYEQEI